MAKLLTGKVVSVKMQNTIVVEVTRRTPHPLYKKLIKVSKKFLADTAGQTVELGQTVSIVETKPMAKNKHFKLMTNEVKKEEKTTKETKPKNETKEDKPKGRRTAVSTKSK